MRSGLPPPGVVRREPAAGKDLDGKAESHGIGATSKSSAPEMSVTIVFVETRAPGLGVRSRVRWGEEEDMGHLPAPSRRPERRTAPGDAGSHRD